MKKIALLSFLFCLSFAGLSAQDDYTRVKNYFVGMNVHPDNSYDVVEEITAHFAEPHHGIYRYIPYIYGMLGKTYAVEINDIDVDNEPFELDSENDNVLIKIGDADTEISGDRKYTIHYTIQNRDDRIDACDMFYHSILGDHFQLPVDSISFRIAFEKKLPSYAKDSLQVFSGPAESAGNELGAKAWINNDTIFGYAVNVPMENAVTVRLRLPEGYYAGEETVTPDLAYILLSIIAVLLAVIFSYEFTLKHPSVTKQIEFYPPDDMCSAEVGTVIDGTVDKIDLASLIPWFASKGYLRIDEKEEKGLFGKKKFLEITKLMHLPSDTPVYQANFFRTLFKKSDTVRLDKMKNSEEDIKEVAETLKDMYKGDRKLTSWHWSVFLLIPLLFLGAGFLIAALPFKFLEYGDTFANFFLWGLPFAIGAFMVLNLTEGKLFRKAYVGKVLSVVRFVCMLFVMYIFLNFNDELIVDRIWVYAVFILCFFSVEFCDRLNVNSEYRAELIGKLLGLKEFIETAEEPRLRSLLQDDPQYFYRILPYAMVFEVSDVWADHFKNIRMESPDWYNSSDMTSIFIANSFVHSLSSASKSAITTMAPSTSSGGGGFSGGGTGGGGGGAW